MIGQLKHRLLLGSACFLLLASPVRGQKLPPVNLGSTSFLDGGVPAGPGFYFQQYMQLYTSDRFNDSRGREVSGFPDLDIWLSLTQLSYLSDQDVFFGGKWAFDLLVPFVLDDFSFDADGKPHPRHANVVGWSEDMPKHELKNIQQRIAAEMQLELRNEA